jgi:hypothetical protein
VHRWLLLAYFQNATMALSWAEVLQYPELDPSHGRCPVLPQLTPLGLPTGHSWPLRYAQVAFAGLLRAAGYLDCTAHGEL